MINVVIKDNNAAYAMGLRHYLQQVLPQNYLRQLFCSSVNLACRRNILFYEVDPTVDCLIAASCIAGGANGVIFFIMDRQAGKQLRAGDCLKYFPVIFRDEPLAIVREKVMQRLRLWQRVGYGASEPGHCTACGRPRLTKNETKVIALLAKEFSLTETAWVLGKNVKTVFTQKKSAMKKLNLTTGRELSSFIIKHRQVLGML